MYRNVTETSEERRERCRRNASQPKKPWSQWNHKQSREEKLAQLAEARTHVKGSGCGAPKGSRNAAGKRSDAFRKACQEREVKKQLKGGSGIRSRRVAGHFESKRFGIVWYDSKYELDFIRACDADLDVLSLTRAGLTIDYDDDGFTRKYIPDFLVGRKRLGFILVEVKPKRYLSWTKNKKKFEAGRKYVATKGWTFQVVTEDMIHDMLISSQASEESDEGSETTPSSPERVKGARVSRTAAVVGAMVLMLASLAGGYDIVRYSDESRRAGIKSPATATIDNMEANANIPQLDVILTSTPVTARMYKLRARWSLEAEQDLKAYHGLSAEDEIVQYQANEINRELCYRVIRTLRQRASAGAVTWSQTPAAGVPWKWHKEELYDKFVELSELIFESTQRWGATWAVCGVNVVRIIETLDRFVPAGAQQGKESAGIQYVGTLGEYEIFKDPTINRNEWIMGYKGEGLLYTGFIHAVYIGLYTTPTVTLDDFISRKGMATRAAQKPINMRMYGIGQVTA